MSARTATTTRRRPETRPARPGSRPSAVATGVAVLGTVLAIATLTGRGAPDPAVGVPVDTDFGTFTVTRASTGFVPATQGPPTMKKMMGLTGTSRLQVWVRLVNEDDRDGVNFSADQLRLTLPGEPPRSADGSTLQGGNLPLDAAIDGQVWFELQDRKDAEAPHALLFTAPDGRQVEVPLKTAPAPKRPSPHQQQPH